MALYDAHSGRNNKISLFLYIIHRQLSGVVLMDFSDGTWMHHVSLSCSCPSALIRFRQNVKILKEKWRFQNTFRTIIVQQAVCCKQPHFKVQLPGPGLTCKVYLVCTFQVEMFWLKSPFWIWLCPLLFVYIFIYQNYKTPSALVSGHVWVMAALSSDWGAAEISTAVCNCRSTRKLS